MLPHLQLSHFHRAAQEENLHFTLSTSSSLRKKDTMSFLIRWVLHMGCYSVSSYSLCLNTTCFDRCGSGTWTVWSRITSYSRSKLMGCDSCTSRCYSGYHGNILVCLLLFHLYPDLSTVVLSAQRFYFYLLLFAALLWFTMVLHAFVEVLRVFLQGTSTDIIWCTNTKIKGFCFSWKHFFMFQRWVFRQNKKRLKTIQEKFSNNEYSLDEYVSALSNWVGFRKF